MNREKWKLLFGQWLFRRRGVMPAFFAIAFLPVLDSFQFIQNSHVRQLYWELGCLAISLFGLFIRVMTVAFVREGSSGRELSTPRASLDPARLLARFPRFPPALHLVFQFFSSIVDWRTVSTLVDGS